MLNATVDFINAINAPERNVKAVVIANIVDGVSATGSVGVVSGITSFCNGSFRPNELTHEGSVILETYDGYIGDNLSDSAGSIIPTVVTVDYSQAFMSKHLWVVGRLGNHPVDFSVEVKSGGAWTPVIAVTGNTNWCWFLKLANEVSVEAFRVTITKISTTDEKVNLVECGFIYRLLFTALDIISMNILTEVNTESRNPVGTVTSNELSLEINNDEGWYTLTNDGPISDLLHDGIRITTHMGVVLDSGNAEFVPSGTYYITDWDAPAADVTAVITANDILYRLMDKPAPDTLPLTDCTVYDLFVNLFTALGVPSNKYSIDPNLTQSVAIGWIPLGDTSEALQQYAEAGLCAVYTDANEIIQVKRLIGSSSSVVTLNSASQIIDFSNRQSLTSVYSTVTVKHGKPYLSPIQEIARLEDVYVATEPVELKIEFNSTAANVTYVALENAVNSYIDSIMYGTNYITISIINDDVTPETIIVTVVGNEIKTSNNTITASDPELYAKWPDKNLDVGNAFIQNNDVAIAYANSILSFASDPKAFYNLSLRGNPAIELMDTVTIAPDDSLKVSQELLGVVIRNNLTYGDGLEATMLLRKPII